jgi:uncharacterized damage-inducible protein DinB
MFVSPAFVRAMARYNAWQNANVFRAADGLSDQQRKSDCGVFFRSIHATLNHLLWADQLWLMRLGEGNGPAKRALDDGLSLFEEWSELAAERHRFDAVINAWADGVEQHDLDGELEWFSYAANREMRTPKSLVVMHVFNHQTHHRGQVHAALTGFGINPGVTDLPFGPPELRIGMES